MTGWLQWGSARHPLGMLLGFMLLLVAGCGSDSSEEEPRQEGVAQERAAPPLRILTLRQPEGPDFLPRSGLPESAELELAEQFAASEGRPAEVVFVDALADLIPALLQGRGDLIAANFTVTPERKNRVVFTTPVTFVREVVVGRRGETFENAHGLGGRSVVVRAGSSFERTLERIEGQRFQPEFEIATLPPGVSDQALLDGVAEGHHDLTVLDSNTANALLAGRDDLQVALHLGNVRPIAWAVRPDDEALLTRLNHFLNNHHLLGADNRRFLGDLAAIKARGVLRMATRNNAATYFLWRGELLGFEYELVKRFAKQHGLRVAVVVPPDREALLEWVRVGRADLAAASLTITDERQGNGVAFSRPYHRVSELLVTRDEDSDLQSLSDLAGRTVVVRRSSSYWETLAQLREVERVAFELEAAPEEMETEEIIARVAAGEYDLTVADSHIVDIELTWREDIRSAFALGDPRPHGWAVRVDNPDLLQAVNTFMNKEYRGLFYNVTYNKYFESPKKIRVQAESRAGLGADGALSPYDELVQKYARRYGLDWRLVVAQMYQESRFDPNARSWAGALGLMQVLPRTARELGLTDLRDPETGLHAGIRYLDWLRKRFEPELNVADRTWFALAAYNAGVGHVRDARRLARQKGWNPDHWFDNVEKAMLLLAQKEYARRAAHGYVRGQEPVNYVREIRERFRAYAKFTGDA